MIVVALNKLHHAVGHDPAQSDQAAEIARLRRELDWTRMERDVLKKRMARPVCKVADEDACDRSAQTYPACRHGAAAKMESRTSRAS